MFGLCSKINKIAFLQYSTRSAKAFEFLPVPVKTTSKKSKLPPETKIDNDTIQLLERLSLVGFENERGVEIVEDAIKFADQIFEVDTTNVTPLVTVLEDRSALLREDVVVNDVTRSELMSNCKVSVENYFVAPVGNIEYISKEKFLKEEESSRHNTTSSLIDKEKICQN